MSLVEARFDDIANEVVDALWRRAVETARGAFDRVGEAHDSGFLCLRTRTGVAETLLAHLGNILLAHVHDFSAKAGILLLLEGALIEIRNQGGAVVLADDIDDLGVELVFEGQIHALLHMGDDNESTHRRSEVVVGIRAVGDVFGEVVGLDDLADVVEIRGDAADCGIRSDDFCGGFREVRDGQAVMVGARCLKAETLEERVVQVAHLQPRDVGGDFENMLEHWQDAADDDGRGNAGGKGRQALPTDHGPVSLRGNFPNYGADLAKRGGENPSSEPHIDTGPHEATAAADL